jgi:hypothetical protein
MSEECLSRCRLTLALPVVEPLDLLERIFRCRHQPGPAAAQSAIQVQLLVEPVGVVGVARVVVVVAVAAAAVGVALARVGTSDRHGRAQM